MNSILTQTANWAGVTLVISGGQTGADQGGLIGARQAGVRTGGTAPSSFYTDAGPNLLLETFGLVAEGDYRSRTVKNVKNSSGTVLLTCTLDSPGSYLTRNEARRQGKAFFERDINDIVDAFNQGENPAQAIKDVSTEIQRWVISHEIEILNVAGNRERHRNFATARIVAAIIKDVLLNLHGEGLVSSDGVQREP